MSHTGEHPLCRHFLKGHCAREKDCRFSHDIRLPENVKVITLDLDEKVKSKKNREKHTGFSSEVNPDALAYQKYQHPPTPPAQILSFKDINSYNKTRLLPGITHIQFGTGFPVTDEHLRDILEAPHILLNLEVLIIKGVDVTLVTAPKRGKRNSKAKAATIPTKTEAQAIEISNEPLVSIISKSPNLKVLHLTGCTNVDDLALKTVLKNCPHIAELKITGLPNQPGSISTASLLYLVNRGEKLAPDLQELNLVNQNLDLRAVTVLSDSRPEMNIIEGLQCELKKRGIGMSLNDMKGTNFHNTGYIVGENGIGFKYKNCYWPEWGGDYTGENSQILRGGEGPPGFWSDSEESGSRTGSIIELGDSDDDAQLGANDSEAQGFVPVSNTHRTDRDREIDEAVEDLLQDLEAFALNEVDPEKLRGVTCFEDLKFQ
ncbi:hypothetical protein H072_7580 [Dactylellina haptotyla CBS 200.50]|uniref:C3H1-type domain-containing protein n=1 Tax=Dactylellina haptotyla (strain CBS 200.50) TaxID=1284197 RepID=S8A6Z5_DACHA|nr:hypothetical protein H072_7580 [Dactylellina haptotyla CBS 200.50]